MQISGLCFDEDSQRRIDPSERFCKLPVVDISMLSVVLGPASNGASSFDSVVAWQCGAMRR